MDFAGAHDFGLIEPLLKPALRARLVPGEGPVASARYGGVPAGVEGEAWPSCPHCKQALDFFAQFPVDQTLWRFFYCLACDEDTGSALLPVSLTQDLVPHPRAPKPSSLVPHVWTLEPVMSLPVDQEVEGLAPAHDQGVALLLALDDASDAVYRAARDALEARGVDLTRSTRIGGYPNPIQDPIDVTCPQCDRDMVYLARLASHDEIHWMWGDLGMMFLHACPVHPQHTHAEMQCH